MRSGSSMQACAFWMRADTTWRSQDLKKVFDRLLFGRQDIPDGALAGMIKRVNDSMNETR